MAAGMLPGVGVVHQRALQWYRGAPDGTRPGRAPSTAAARAQDCLHPTPCAKGRHLAAKWHKQVGCGEGCGRRDIAKRDSQSQWHAKQHVVLAAMNASWVCKSSPV